MATVDATSSAENLPGLERAGVLAAGNFVVDRVVLIDTYPLESTLASIDAERSSSGGCPYTVLKDLAMLGATFGLAAIGALGADPDGEWVLRDCAVYGIDTRGVVRLAGATTSYTYAMTVRTTGRRTFFHRRGANALLAPEHFDFTASTERIFVYGYLMLLDALDRWVAPGTTGASTVLERARAAGMETVVDLVSAAHPEYHAMVWSALPQIDHLLLNEVEASLLLGRSYATYSVAHMLDAAREIAAGGVRRCVVVHCEAGALALDCRTGEAVVQGSVAVPAENIVGATGAGDAFTAGYVLSLHAGDPLELRLRDGVCAAAASLSDASASGSLQTLEACRRLAQSYGYRSFALD